MISRYALGTIMLAAGLSSAGCFHAAPAAFPLGPAGLPAGAGLDAVGAIPNPIVVSGANHEFVWNQVVDVLDDHFRVQREERIQVVGNLLTEGRIETAPTTGSTLLEPWRYDSTPGPEKLHATLQSIRRRAVARVAPIADGLSVELAVFKELEDVSKPEHATVGAATLRHDGSLVRDAVGEQGRDQARRADQAGSLTLGWIPLGRDFSLEQRLLVELQQRLTVQPPLPRLPPVVIP